MGYSSSHNGVFQGWNRGYKRLLSIFCTYFDAQTWILHCTYCDGYHKFKDKMLLFGSLHLLLGSLFLIIKPYR